MVYLGIDPGSSSGAVACLGVASGEAQDDLDDIFEEVGIDTPFEFGKGTLKEFDDYLKLSNMVDDVYAVVEKVNVHPNTAVSAASSFMRNVGHIQMALTCNSIPFIEVTPRTWMKHYYMKKSPSETKTQWKRRLRELVQQRLPDKKIKATTADAYLIAMYAQETYKH